MPVLDNALLACAIAFTPLMVSMTFGAPITSPAAALTRRVPRIFGHYPNIFLDVLSRDPRTSSAVMQGLFFGRTAPPHEERKTFLAPSIVLGHPRDAIHPFSDAKMLADELPNGRLIEAESLYELRLRPQRLTNEIASFLSECWMPRRTGQRRARSRRSERLEPTQPDQLLRGCAVPASAETTSRAARSPDWIAPSM